MQNYENIEIKTWNFDYYMKFYNETEKENGNIFVKISRDDLLYFLNQQQGQDMRPRNSKSRKRIVSEHVVRIDKTTDEEEQDDIINDEDEKMFFCVG